MTETSQNLLSLMDQLSASELEKLGTEITSRVAPENLPSYANANLAVTLSALPPDKKADAISNAIQAQPLAERDVITRQITNTAISGPNDHTSNKLWVIVVIALSIVLVGSFATLATGVFLPASGAVNPELILTMFTSVVGFLAGLFVPTPSSKTNGY